MTYKNIAAIQSDSSLKLRLTACAAEQKVLGGYWQWVDQNSWSFAAQPGWADAWASALAVHTEAGYAPGDDEAVITDGMILSAVQALNAPADPAS